MRKRALILLALASIVLLSVVAVTWYWVHRYDRAIALVGKKYNLDPALVRAIVYEESFFSPGARSSQNAIGLMQVTPVVGQEWMDAIHAHSVAQAVALVSGKVSRNNEGLEEALSDPIVSLNVGCWYLQSLLNRYRDEPDPVAVALAAYNAGPSNVDRWSRNAERANLSRDEFISRIEFPATRTYVQKIIRRYDGYRTDDPQR